VQNPVSGQKIIIRAMEFSSPDGDASVGRDEIDSRLCENLSDDQRNPRDLIGSLHADLSSARRSVTRSFGSRKNRAGFQDRFN